MRKYSAYISKISNSFAGCG